MMSIPWRIQGLLLVIFSSLLATGVVWGLANDSMSILAMSIVLVAIPILLYLMVFQYRYFMALVVFLFPLSISFDFSGNVISFPSEFMLIFLTAVFFYKILFSGLPDYRFLRNPVSILILLDLLWTLISALTGTMLEVSMKRFIMKLMFVSIFYFSWADLFSKASNVRLFFMSYAVGLIIPILNTIKNHSVHYFMMRAAFFSSEPFYAEHTIYAACLTFVLLALLIMLIYFRKEFSLTSFYLSVPLLALIALGDFLAYSRAAWLSLFAAFVVWMVLQFRIRRRYLISAALLAIVILAWNFSSIADSLQSNRAESSSEDITEHIQSISSVKGDVSNAERLNRWVSAWEMFKTRPFLGFGPGTYQFQYGVFQKPEYLTRISTYKGEKGNAHSEYLNVLAETGIPGLIILILLLYSVFMQAFQLYRKDTSRERKIVILMACVALSSYYVHGFVNCFIDLDKAAILVYSGMAMIAINYNKFIAEKASQTDK